MTEIPVMNNLDDESFFPSKPEQSSSFLSVNFKKKSDEIQIYGRPE
jgi:hypothetical protein